MDETGETAEEKDGLPANNETVIILLICMAPAFLIFIVCALSL
jgi:hypothetical protein